MTPELLRRGFTIGEWRVDPEANQLHSKGITHSIEPRMMDLLVYLAVRSGTTVSKEEIFSAVWPETFVTDSALWKCVFLLRQILEEDPKHPKLIVTVPKRGYRLRAVLTQGAPAPEGLRPGTKVRLWRIGAIGATVLFLLLVGRFWVSGTNPYSDSPEDRPTVLIARLENRTGDDLLDGTLEVVLEGRLNDSRRVQVVSRARVEDLLRLMRKPTDLPLTAKLAREVSQRDGDMDFVVTGQIDGLGSRYHVTLRLLDGQSQELIASNDLNANTLDDTLPLAEDQASWLLDQLGVEKPERKSQPERVTTKSLEALRLYTRGVAAYDGSTDHPSLQRNAEAIQLFEEATKIDPEFASAYLMLAWSIFMVDQLDPKSATEQEVVHSWPEGTHKYIVTRPAWDAMRRAMEMRGHASLVERAFIRACYLHWQGQFREAVPFYRLAADLRPEHRWAASNLMRLGNQLRDPDLFREGLLAHSRGAPLELLGADLRRIVQLSKDWTATRRIRDRMSQLAAKAPHPAPKTRPDGTIVDQREEAVATLRGFDIWSLWREGRYAEANAELTLFSRQVENLHTHGTEVANNGYAFVLGEMQVMMGRLRDAKESERRYKLHPRDGKWASWSWGSSPSELLAFLVESAEGLGDPNFCSIVSGMLLDRNFATPEQLEQFTQLGPMTKKLLLALHSSRPEERIKGLEDRIAAQRPGWGPIPRLRLKLARELAQQSHDDQATEILKGIVAAKNRTFGGDVVTWQKAALKLARAYRRQGRFDKAKPLLSELAEMLQFADADHPILGEIQAIQPR